MVTSNKRKHDADDSEISNPRIRTTSPTHIDGLGDSALMFDTSNRDTIPPWIPEQAIAEAIPTSQELSQNVDESGTITSNPLPQIAADQYGAFDTNVSTMNAVADINIDGAQENGFLLPLTDISVVANAATSAPASPDHQLSPELQPESECGQEVQILPVNHSVDGTPTPGEVESLINTLKRTSIDAKRRASLCLSTITGYSAVSQTRSSVRSLFFPSESMRPSSWTKFLERSSKRSLKRASIVPSEMAGTMLEPIDEQLADSRASGSRLEDWVSPVLHPKKVRQERFWIAVQEGNIEDVADVLSALTSTVPTFMAGRHPLQLHTMVMAGLSHYSWSKPALM